MVNSIFINSSVVWRSVRGQTYILYKVLKKFFFTKIVRVKLLSYSKKVKSCVSTYADDQIKWSAKDAIKQVLKIYW